jgi:hypothetical protein
MHRYSKLFLLHHTPLLGLARKLARNSSNERARQTARLDGRAYLNNKFVKFLISFQNMTLYVSTQFEEVSKLGTTIQLIVFVSSFRCSKGRCERFGKSLDMGLRFSSG